MEQKMPWIKKRDRSEKEVYKSRQGKPAGFAVQKNQGLSVKTQDQKTMKIIKADLRNFQVDAKVKTI